MKNYRLVIQYDGTKYNGWQKQGNTPNTIQERFYNVLSKMCGRHIEIFASGRTDAGVHASGQVANFKCDTLLSCSEILEYLNHYLPEDIKVLSIEEVDERFHSRLNAISKTYEYSISTTKADVFKRKYVYTELVNLNTEVMSISAKELLGTHDFLGFSALKKTKKSTIRTINYIEIKKENDIVKIIINGNGFLYNMVRIISGTLFEIGIGKKDKDIIKDILETKNRELAGQTLPACGLTLKQVIY